MLRASLLLQCGFPLPCLSLLQDIITDLRLVPTALDPEGIPEQAWQRRDGGASSMGGAGQSPGLKAAMVRKVTALAAYC